MQGSIKLSVLGALLVFGPGCRGGDTPAQMDLATPPADTDMRAPSEDGPPPLNETTIRDINGLKFKDGDRVKFTGVVTSPKPWAVAQGRDCYFFIYVAQPDAAPTLKDGLRVGYLKFGSGDMGASDSACRSDAGGGPPEMLKAMTGNKVEITGTVDIANVRRQVLLTNMMALKDLGPSPDEVKPVDISPADFPRPGTGMMADPKFKESQGALVRLSNVVTSSRRATFPFDFNVSAMAGAPAAGIDTSYLWTIDPATGRAADFVPPMDGVTYTSITGIVSIDFYKVWVRTPQDLVPKM